MDEIEARRILRTIRQELIQAQATEAAAHQRAGALEKMMSGLVELFPGLAGLQAEEPPDEVTKPRGQEAVLKVLEAPESRGRYWTVSAMTEALRERDWLPDSSTPANAVRTTLDRLAEKDPEVVHKGPGEHGVVWFWQGEGMQSPRFAGDQRRTDPSDAPPLQSIGNGRTESATGGFLPQEAPDPG